MVIEEEFLAEFKLPRGLMFEPSTMTDFFLPDQLLDKIVATTNAYAKKNNSKRKYILVKRKDILKTSLQVTNNRQDRDRRILTVGRGRCDRWLRARLCRAGRDTTRIWRVL